jgi:hypothetical protein
VNNGFSNVTQDLRVTLTLDDVVVFACVQLRSRDIGIIESVQLVPDHKETFLVIVVCEALSSCHE